jgi:hypothetical protein
MVTFPPAGRMGNYLFESSCVVAYSLKHNLDFTMPFTTNSDYWNPIYLKHLQNKNYNPNLEQIRIPENGHQYQDIPFEESWINKNIIIEGYRQSYKYIDDYRSEILYLFGFPYEKKDGVVSIHVRRGDYLVLRDKHPHYGKEWIDSAMSMFPDYRFKFFSDDIKWCRETFGNREDCEFSTNSNEIDDLVEMSCCEHQINSSSTFSWWGAYLNRNQNKIVVTPEKWFVDGFGGLDTSNIIPPNWIKLCQ